MKQYVTENNNNLLPKNVRQVGDIDPDKRVYIEDYALSFIKDLYLDEDEEGRVGILLGEEQTMGDEHYVFVKGAMEITNASVFEGTVSLTEETWNMVKANKMAHFDGMKTVGWFIVSSNIHPDGNSSIERTHIDSFGRYSILLDVNPGENSEEVYSCFDGGLEPLEGYMVYFDRNDEMQRYMASVKEGRSSTKADETATRRYRQIMREKKNEPKARQELSLMYVLSAILVIFVLAIGVGKLNSEKNVVNEPESATNGNYIDDSSNQVNATVGPIEDETLNIEYASGDVETTQAPTEEVSEPTQETSETETQTETETTETQTEAPTYRVYIVKSGDTLSGIALTECGDGSWAKINEILALNGITDGGNSINIGDEILLP